MTLNKGLYNIIAFYANIFLIMFCINCSCCVQSLDPLMDRDYYKLFLEPDVENLTDYASHYYLKDTLQLIEHWGYTGEKHQVTTEDGYILSIFRIPPKKKKSTPILILHGFLATSELWLIRGKEDLPLVLWEAGFDVWLGNYRGGYNGQQHVNISTNHKKFWDFSFHEHGIYDVPAMVDHILLITGEKRISLIGHSMGNAAFMVMSSMRPQYNDKIHVFVSLAPYVISKYALDMLPKVLLDFGIFTFRQETPLFKFLFQSFKGPIIDSLGRRRMSPLMDIALFFPNLIHTLVSFTLGESLNQMDWKLYPVIFGYFPSGSSYKTLKHLAYLNFKARFHMFDYGEEENMKRYNSLVAPDYDLSKIRVPIMLYRGENDVLNREKDFFKLSLSLPNVIGTHVIPNYNHLDFMMANNTRTELYDSIVYVIKKYSTIEDSFRRRYLNEGFERNYSQSFNITPKYLERRYRFPWKTPKTKI